MIQVVTGNNPKVTPNEKGNISEENSTLEMYYSFAVSVIDCIKPWQIFF